LPRTSTHASPLSALTILNGEMAMSRCTASVSNLRPMRRLMENRVFSGLVTAWRLACWPTGLSPLSVNATMDGVVRLPSALAMTTGSPPSMMATQEFVVPRSIPITLLIYVFLLLVSVHRKTSNCIREKQGMRWKFYASALFGAPATETMAGRSRRSLRRYPFWNSSITVLGATSALSIWHMAW